MIAAVPSLIRLRPRADSLYLSQNYTVLSTGRDGFIKKNSPHGLFVHRTRLLARYRYLIHGVAPQPVALSQVEQHSWLGYYIASPLPAEAKGALSSLKELLSNRGRSTRVSPQHCLELRLSRFVGDGLHEDVDVTNYTGKRCQIRLELVVDADFADQEEAENGKRQQKGHLTRRWQTSEGGAQLVFDYHAEHAYDHQGDAGTARLHRGAIVFIENAGSTPTHSISRVSFALDLEPHQSWHACIKVCPVIDGTVKQPLYPCRAFRGVHSGRDRHRLNFLEGTAHASAPGSDTLTPVVLGAFERARADLASLRLYDLDHDEHSWVPAAGLPMYIGLFGRDTLLTGREASVVSQDMMRGALDELPRWQGTRIDDWRDEQPGRILHQAQDGPLEVLMFNPHGRYYGEITGPAFYPALVGHLWHWTGKKEMVEPFVEPALKALRWLDGQSRLRDDGFYWYQTHSEQGLKNQAWMDSGDSIVYPDGSQVPDPIAACEVQGFAYLAKVCMAEILWWFDRKDEAKRFYHEAQELKIRFNDAFWMDDEKYFALGLDPNQKRIPTIYSNPACLMATGIVDETRARHIADRLMQPDLFTGWGVRTLSSDNPAYNPFSYQRGAVWPLEQAMCALGFMLYGLHEPLEILVHAQFEAATLFQYYRLPELFGGQPRDADHPFPGIYPNANSPQAWSSAAVFAYLEAMLGIYPYAPLNALFVDPHMPEWFPDVTLSNLHVGAATAKIRFFRTANGTSSYEVLDLQGKLHVIRQPSPWSITAGFGERFRDAVTSLLPG